MCRGEEKWLGRVYWLAPPFDQECRSVSTRSRPIVLHSTLHLTNGTSLAHAPLVFTIDFSFFPLPRRYVHLFYYSVAIISSFSTIYHSKICFTLILPLKSSFLFLIYRNNKLFMCFFLCQRSGQSRIIILTSINIIFTASWANKTLF